MRIRKFEYQPVDQQGRWEEELDGRLQGALHVEMFTKPTDNWGGERVLIIYALYNP